MSINNIKKNNMFSVMNNSGFGTMKWAATNGIMFTLPNKAIRKSDGAIKKAWGKRLASLTLNDCQWMAERGASITMV